MFSKYTRIQYSSDRPTACGIFCHWRRSRISSRLALMRLTDDSLMNNGMRRPLYYGF